MSSQATIDGTHALTVTFKLGTDIDSAQVQVQNRVAQALPRLPEEVRALGVTTQEGSPDLMMVVHLTSPDGRYDSLYLRNYATLQRPRRARAPARHGRRARVRRGRLLDARLARSARSSPPRDLTAGDVVARSASRTCRSRPARSARRRAEGTEFQLALNAKGRLVNEEEFGDIVIKTGRTARSCACATSRASSSARPVLRCAACSTTRTRSRSPIFQAPGSNALELSDAGPRDDGGAEEDFPGRASTTTSSTTRRCSCASRSRPWSTRCSRRSRWSCSSSSCSCRPGARRSFRWSRCRCRSSARSR